jgi:hypothetical protein
MSIWAMRALDAEWEVDPEHPQRIMGRHPSQLDEKPASPARPMSRCATRCHAVEGLAALLDTESINSCNLAKMFRGLIPSCTVSGCTAEWTFNRV